MLCAYSGVFRQFPSWNIHDEVTDGASQLLLRGPSLEASLSQVCSQQIASIALA